MASARRMEWYQEPAKGSALDIPQSPWLVDAAFLARFARLMRLGKLRREMT